MYYSELLDLLQTKFKITSHSTATLADIKDIQLCSGNLENSKEHVLYLGKIPKNFSKITSPVQALCYGKFSESTIYKSNNLAEIREEDLPHIFNEAKNLIFEDLKIDAEYSHLLRMTLDDAAPSDLINVASRLVGNALIVVDNSMKVLLHSNTYEIADPKWQDNIDRGYSTDTFYRAVLAQDSIKNWTRDVNTRIVTIPGDQVQKLVSKIVIDGHVVGSVIMIEHDTPIQRMHYRQLPYIGKSIYESLNRDPSYSYMGGSIAGKIIFDILDGADSQNIQERIGVAGLKFPETMSVLVIRFIELVESRYLKNALYIHLKQILPNSYFTNYKNYIVAIVENKQQLSIDDEQIRSLTEFSKCEKVQIGISCPFSNVLQLKSYYNQSVTAIKLGVKLEKKDSLLFYKNCGFFDILNRLSKTTQLTDFCHPALEQLQEYDKKNGTEMYLSLGTYLRNNKNLRATANELFIHKNSLHYRLKRILDLTGLDLEDRETSFALDYSYEIKNFIK